MHNAQRLYDVACAIFAEEFHRKDGGENPGFKVVCY